MNSSHVMSSLRGKGASPGNEQNKEVVEHGTAHMERARMAAPTLLYASLPDVRETRTGTLPPSPLCSVRCRLAHRSYSTTWNNYY